MTRRPTAPRQVAALRLVPAPGEPQAPTLRPDLIARARDRLRGHFYDRADVRRALVEALLVEFAAPQTSR